MLMHGLVSHVPIRGPSRPVFIIGCGRSGKTTLGTALSKHSKVTYLDERRDLWFHAYPETDIWTDRAAARQGRVVLTAADAERAKTRTLRRLFAFETIKTRKPQLLENLPINSFRLRFINAIFPDARIVFIWRNGLEVARSIEQECGRGRWFGANAYKWDQLLGIARMSEKTAGLPALCTSDFEKGLLEWRLSNEAIVDFLRSLPEERSCEVAYDALTREPVRTVERVVAFLGLENESQVASFVRKIPTRRAETLGERSLSETERLIGGDLLSLSVSRQESDELTRLFTDATAHYARQDIEGSCGSMHKKEAL